MTEIFQGPLDAGIAPRRILGGHSHDETPNLPQDSRPADSRRCIRPFPGNEQPVPPQNRVGSDDRGNLAQDPASEAPAADSQSAALVIGQLQRSADQLLPQNPILLSQILDNIPLLPIHPAGEEHDQKSKRASVDHLTSVVP